MRRLLTPVAKALFTDLGHRSADEALQAWGGYGFVHDYGIEQTVRDSRIAMIYEGTNEIQAIDLVQRKPGALRNGTPFMDLPPALLRLRQSLMRHAGGDRVMAQVLAVVPQAGLDAVLVAVEVLLEGATPNGGISVEHVRNVLARLSSPPMPQQAETSLQLSEVPLANTARYDGLRSGVEVSYD